MPNQARDVIQPLVDEIISLHPLAQPFPTRFRWVWGSPLAGKTTLFNNLVRLGIAVVEWDETWKIVVTRALSYHDEEEQRKLRQAWRANSPLHATWKQAHDIACQVLARFVLRGYIIITFEPPEKYGGVLLNAVSLGGVVVTRIVPQPDDIIRRVDALNADVTDPKAHAIISRLGAALHHTTKWNEVDINTTLTGRIISSGEDFIRLLGLQAKYSL